ncbi:hypothetical protein IC575_029954 [Cucumis melo]
MSRNSLLSLVDSDGSRISSHDGVVHLVVNYFRNSLGSQKIGYRELSPVIEDIVQFRWSEECCQALQIPTIREEVRRVLFSMDSGKAPVPDGFSVGFIKSAWSVVGEDFCDAVLHFFETCYLPIGVNATAITLIPKRRGAERMEEFRPISCCNVIYKCISKILTDRLHVWLPSFISSNQSAFIPGRSIIDNILLCQELVGGYHLNSGKPRYTLKIDLQKAYDSVNWDFLFGLLIAIGTPLKFVSWIRACVTSSMFSIMINGSFEGFFHGRKGVRQGDPLSPFLFVMVMEVLSRMLNKIPQSFQFHRRCEKVKLNHLTFADDLMIFCAADEPSLSFIREYLQKFGELSGLFVNLRKSSIFVAEVSNEAASHLAASMGFVFGNLPVRYLGLPLLIGRLRSNDCAPLIQRMTSRIRSWTAQVLSFVGRLQLVRSVLRSLQVYWPSVFVLPAYVHNEVDKILRSYLWRGKEEGRGGIKVAWVEVCLPFEEGGLAIRDGPSWNIASTLKILWGVPFLSRLGKGCFMMRQVGGRLDFLILLAQMGNGNGRESMELIDLWDRVQAISPSLSVSDRWVWVPGRQGGFSITSPCEAIRPMGGRVRWVGLLWGGGISQSISFVCGWPLKIGWTLEIDCIGGIIRYRCRAFFVRGVWSLAITCSFRVRSGGMFGLGFFGSWLPLIGLGIGGLSCLGFVIRVLGRV